MKSIFIFIVLLNSSLIFAQDKEEPEYEMKTYYFVFLNRGPNKDIDSVKLKEIQAGHMANINRLVEAGKIHIAGPFLDNTDMRGIFIMDAESMEEAKELIETDPAVKAGRLSYEIKPWYGAKGSCLK